jgi:ankyrin repeat protein
MANVMNDEKDNVQPASVKPFTLSNMIDDLCSVKDVKAALEGGETNVSDEEVEAFQRNVRLQLIAVSWTVGINEAEGLMKEESKLSAPVSDAEERAPKRLLTNETFLSKRRKLHGIKILQLLGTFSASVEISTAIDALRRKMAISSSDMEAEHEVEAEFWLWPKYMRIFEDFGELRDITTTPFMVEIVVGILRELHGQQPTPAQFKQKLALQMGADARYEQEFDKASTVSDAEDIHKLVETVWQDWKRAGISTIEGLQNAQSHLEPANRSKQVSDWLSENSSRKPLIEKHGNVLKRKHLVRYVIYDTFVQHFIRREAMKSLQLSGCKFSVHEIMSDAAMYANKLAVKMTTENMVKVQFSDNDSIFSVQSDWDVFFNQDEITARIRSSVPCQPSGGALEFIHKSVQEFCVAKCILDEVLTIMEKAEIKAHDTEGSDELGSHPMVQVASALERGFDLRQAHPRSAYSLKQEQTSDNRLMLLLVQAGLPEDDARSYSQNIKEEHLEAVNQHLAVKDHAAGEATEESRVTQLQAEILANDAVMKKVTGMLKVTKQADRKRISNRLAIFISELEDAALNKVDLGPEEAIVDFLVDVMISDPNKATALMVVSQFFDHDRLQQLADNVKTICTMRLPKRKGGTILHVAAEYDNMAVAKGVINFLKHIDDVRENVDDEEKDKSTDGKIMPAKALGVDMTDNEGATALHLAAAKNHVFMVALLLQNNADVGITKISGIGVMHLAAKAGAHKIVKRLIKHSSQLIVRGVKVQERADTAVEDIKDNRKYINVRLAKDPQFTDAFARFDTDLEGTFDSPIKANLKDLRSRMGMTGRVVDFHSDRTLSIRFSDDTKKVRLPLEALDGDYRTAVLVTMGEYKGKTGRLTKKAYEKLGGRRRFKAEYTTHKAEARTGRLEPGDRVQLTSNGNPSGCLGRHGERKIGMVLKDDGAQDRRPFQVQLLLPSVLPQAQRTDQSVDPCWYKESDVKFVVESDRKVRTDKYEVVLEGAESSDNQDSTVTICGSFLKLRCSLPNVEILNAAVKTDAAQAFARELARNRGEDLVKQTIKMHAPNYNHDWLKAEVIAYDENQNNYDGDPTQWQLKFIDPKEEKDQWVDLLGNTDPDEDLNVHGFTLGGDKSGGDGVVGTTPMMVAAQENQFTVLKLLIDAGADTGALDNEKGAANRTSALQYAYEAAKKRMVKGERDQNEAARVLEEAGADGFTPLHVAAKYGQLDDRTHWSAIWFSGEDANWWVRSGLVSAQPCRWVQALRLETRAFPEVTQIQCASCATKGLTSLVTPSKWCIECDTKCVPKTALEPSNNVRIYSRTVLQLAAENGRYKTVENLIAAITSMEERGEGITVEETISVCDNANLCALHLACKNASIRESAKASYREHATSKNKRNDTKCKGGENAKKGDSPASHKDFLRTIDILLGEGNADCNSRPGVINKRSPLMIATTRSVLTLLLKQKTIKVNATGLPDGVEPMGNFDEDGLYNNHGFDEKTFRETLDEEKTALFYHCEQGNTEAVETLLYHGRGKGGNFTRAEASKGGNPVDGLATVLWSDNAYGVREGDVVEWGDSVCKIRVGDLVDLRKLPVSKDASTIKIKSIQACKDGKFEFVLTTAVSCNSGKPYQWECGDIENEPADPHINGPTIQRVGGNARLIRLSQSPLWVTLDEARYQQAKSKGSKNELLKKALEITKMLLDKGGEDINLNDAEFRSPLFIAIRCYKRGADKQKAEIVKQLVEILLRHGADPMLTGDLPSVPEKPIAPINEGKSPVTALGLACWLDCETVADLFLLQSDACLADMRAVDLRVSKEEMDQVVQCFSGSDGDNGESMVDAKALMDWKSGGCQRLKVAEELQTKLTAIMAKRGDIWLNGCFKSNGEGEGKMMLRRKQFEKHIYDIAHNGFTTHSATAVIRKKELMDDVPKGSRGKSSLMVKLHKQRAEGYTQLHTDVLHGLVSSPAELKKMFQKHREEHTLDNKTHEGETVLHLAVIANSVDCVRELLPYCRKGSEKYIETSDKVLNIDERNKCGFTALMYAATEDMIGTVAAASSSYVYVHLLTSYIPRSAAARTYAPSQTQQDNRWGQGPPSHKRHVLCGHQCHSRKRVQRLDAILAIPPQKHRRTFAGEEWCWSRC